MQRLPRVDPMPPRAAGPAWLGSASALLRVPTAFFQHPRPRRGNTFLSDTFGQLLERRPTPTPDRWGGSSRASLRRQLPGRCQT